MNETSASDAERDFVKVLDAVEHEGSPLRIERSGHVVAQIVPPPANGAEIKRLLMGFCADPDWSKDIASI